MMNTAVDVTRKRDDGNAIPNYYNKTISIHVPRAGDDFPNLSSVFAK